MGQQRRQKLLVLTATALQIALLVVGLRLESIGFSWGIVFIVMSFIVYVVMFMKYWKKYL